MAVVARPPCSSARITPARETNFRNNFQGAGPASFRACLLSGPPGIGKTTAAHIVAKELGFDLVEWNASDSRTKKALDVLNQGVIVAFRLIYLQKSFHELIGNRSVAEYFDHADPADGVGTLTVVQFR